VAQNPSLWMQHLCTFCGARFRYRTQREAQAYPCPSCGQFQPAMVALMRRDRYGLAFGIGLVLLPAPFVLLMSDWWLSQQAAMWLMAILGLHLLAWHAWAALFNPNRDTTANRRLASRRIEARALVMDNGSQGEGASATLARRDQGLMLRVALAFVGVAVIPMPEIARVVRAWPANARAAPPVAGPGERVRLYFPEHIRSLNRMWRGDGTVEIANSAQLGTSLYLVASSKSDSWASTIYESPDFEKMSRKDSQVWLEVVLPERPELAGRTIELVMSLDVTYPVEAGHSHDRRERFFKSEHRAFKCTVHLQVAPRGAASAYESMFVLGTLGGTCLLFAASIWIYAVLHAAASGRHGTLMQP
jgi:hypothetical protein